MNAEQGEGRKRKLTVHAPQLDLSVVGSGDKERKVGVEGDPVHTTIVALRGRRGREGGREGGREVGSDSNSSN